MKTIARFATRLEAELARLRLEGAGIEASIDGIDAGMEGGSAGVHLRVPEPVAAAAIAWLARR